VLLIRRCPWQAPHQAAFEITFDLKMIIEILLLEASQDARPGACHLRLSYPGIGG
jgi:hypothetical protein